MRQNRVHMCTHHNVWSALGHPSVWVGVAGALSAISAQLDKPYNIILLAISGVCSVIAIFIRTPQELDDAPIAKEKTTWEQ
jgi:hypothetical protein